MPAGDLRYPPQRLGEGQPRQHDDGLNDVFVDLVAFFSGQRAAPDAEIVQFAPVVQQFRDLQPEPPGIIRRNPILRGPCKTMFRFIGQQRFHHRQRQGRNAFLAGSLLVRQTDPVIEGALPSPLGDALNAGDLRWTHKLAALITAGDEREFLIQRLPLRCQIRL